MRKKPKNRRDAKARKEAPPQEPLFFTCEAVFFSLCCSTVGGFLFLFSWVAAGSEAFGAFAVGKWIMGSYLFFFLLTAVSLALAYDHEEKARGAFYTALVLSLWPVVMVLLAGILVLFFE